MLIGFFLIFLVYFNYLILNENEVMIIFGNFIWVDLLGFIIAQNFYLLLNKKSEAIYNLFFWYINLDNLETIKLIKVYRKNINSIIILYKIIQIYIVNNLHLCFIKYRYYNKLLRSNTYLNLVSRYFSINFILSLQTGRYFLMLIKVKKKELINKYKNKCL